LHASPNEIGLTLAMFGFGMFAFEWVWGVVADRVGYGAPLVASQLLYGAFILLLSRVQSIPLIAVGYLLASGMMVAVGPIARSYLGTTLHARLRATGLALLASQWVIAEAVGAGVGGQLIDRFPIRDVMLAGAAMLAVGLIGGVLLVPGGNASDRWGRRPTMVTGAAVSALGFVVYALAGNFALVIVGAAIRALGASLIWPAATAWVAESMPRHRHAFYLGLFGEFENIGVTVGP